MKRSHHEHVHHIALSYPVTLGQRLYVMVLSPIAAIALIAFFTAFYPGASSLENVTFGTILLACMYTLGRIFAAYALAAVVAVPLALLVEYNRTVETFLLPVFDVFESVPNLAVLPALLVFFLQFHFLDGAAIVILFLNILWSIVFALVGGLKVIPRDVKDAAYIFGLRGFSYVRKLILPAIFPEFVTGSILGVASGWNIIIVAEAVHNYLPGSNPSQDLFGIGSILVSTAANGQTSDYILAFSVMIGVIALFNFFVWQKLLNYSQRFRFE